VRNSLREAAARIAPVRDRQRHSVCPVAANGRASGRGEQRGLISWLHGAAFSMNFALSLDESAAFPSVSSMKPGIILLERIP